MPGEAYLDDPCLSHDKVSSDRSAAVMAKQIVIG